MIKIGDFSKLSKVSVKTLRYYDETGLLSPIETDRSSGYRYYSLDQLPRLNRILALKDLGFSLEQIAQALESGITLEQLRGMLRLKQAEQQQRVHDEQERLLRVEARLRQIEMEADVSKYDVVIKKLDTQKVASIRKTLDTPRDIGGMFETIFGYLGRKGVRPLGPPSGIWHDLEYKDKDLDTEVVVPIAQSFTPGDGVQPADLPAVPAAACTIHQGAYEDFSQAYTAIMGWITTNGYRMAGPCREIYLRGPGPGPTDPNTYITEIQIPVEKA
ncbi:MAG: MerR family transcriptional regulator [Anaerolineales bacterium]|nr:MerR family transcriptional regulator [Anaerolineales bacterium]